MRKLRLKYYVIVLLATLSLTSVGFASWIISDTVTETTSGLIIVDDIIKANDYITCGTITNPLLYFKNGFLDSEDNISPTGTITVPITVDMDECNAKFEESNLEIQLVMTEEKIKLFGGDINMNLNVVVSDGTNNITSTTYISTDGISAITTFILPITSGNTNLNITYSFTISNSNNLTEEEYITYYQTYFKENIYPKMVQDDFDFKFSAKLTGVQGA